MVDQPRFPHGYAPAVPFTNQRHALQAYIDINDDEGASEVAIANSGSTMEVRDGFIPPHKRLTCPDKHSEPSACAADEPSTCEAETALYAEPATCEADEATASNAG